MNPKEFSNLQNLCNALTSLKKQIVKEELPHYGNESLFFRNDEITTGIMNNRIEIKIHMFEKKLLYFDNENGFFIDVMTDGISEKLEKIVENHHLIMPEIRLNTIPEKSIDDYYEFAFNANETLELFRMRLSGKFTMVHLWPHHFDFSVEWFTGKNDEQIGTGISPGDEQYESPYLYMNPWPFNKKITEEKLPIGEWHTDGWNGVKVGFDELLQDGPPKAADNLLELFKICKRNFL